VIYTPISSGEFEKGRIEESVIAKIEKLLCDNPDEAYSFVEIRDSVFGKSKTSDLGALVVQSIVETTQLMIILASLSKENRIQMKMIDGTSYFKCTR
jgi:hypothetical protein